MKKYIKRFIYLFIFIGFVSAFGFCLSSCQKTDTSSIQNSSEFYEGDEYDQGKTIDEPDEPEEAEELDYSPDAAKMYVIGDSAEVLQDNIEGGCTGNFKYAGYYGVSGPESISAFIITLSDTSMHLTSLSAFSSNLPSLKFDDLQYFTSGALAGKYALTVYCDSLYSFKTKRLKLIYTFPDGKKLSKSGIKIINRDQGSETYYGTRNWGMRYERSKFGKSGEGTVTNITSSYVPELGDVIIMGTSTSNYKYGVITTTPTQIPAKGTKPAKWKFKMVEYNSICNNRKSTKSVSYSDVTQIFGRDKITAATKYGR